MSQARFLTPAIANLRIRDRMHHGVLTCGADDPLRDVAAIMANHRVHAVVVTTRNGERPVGVVSDLDVLAAVATQADCTAGQAGATETLTVSADETLQVAAQLMNEHGVTHLVVVDATEGYPLGVISSLDVAAAYAET